LREHGAKPTQFHGEEIEMMRSSHPVLSYADRVADEMTDAVLLVGRVLVASVFLLTVAGANPTSAYLTSIHFVSPGAMSILARVVEWIVVISLIAGVGTRYGALLGLLFVIVAVVTAHLWWTYPQAAQGLQWIFFTKDLSIAGGLVVLFATGAGRYSVDALLRR
jgi:putative oxidoreductase